MTAAEKRASETSLASAPNHLPGIKKAPTGVKGLDEILNGGFPKGRPTLLCGGPGCGKTLLAMEFLCRGATDHREPGVFVAFEERPEELAANVSSLGFDLKKLEDDGLLVVDYVAARRDELIQTGEFDLGGLFLRIAGAAQSIGAKRIVIDTIEVLFGTIADAAIVRVELARLFSWLKDQGLTVVITAERGEGGSVSRNGIEEYVSDCVIVLDHRINDEHSTRRLRVLKYRGTLHGTDEYPFLISSSGFEVLPVTSLGLHQAAPTTKISIGVPRLDDMLSGGVYQGSSILISGPAGTGKTILAAHFADAACQRGETTLFVSYEESAAQIVRNMESVGINLSQWITSGRLRIESIRPNFLGLEGHLAWLNSILNDFAPTVIVVDPISSLLRIGSKSQIAAMLLREVDTLKGKGISALFTALTPVGVGERTDVEVSSLIDTWIFTSTDSENGERNRMLSIIKSRGMSHSNQLTEFLITDKGVDILEPYVGPSGVLTGTARIVQEMADFALHNQQLQDVEDKRRRLDQRKEDIEARVSALWADHTAEEIEFNRVLAAAEAAGRDASSHRGLISNHRWATSTPSTD